ncbi:hypothetical protein SLE2022_231830 [Rubroshorea leprosula]
MDPMADKQIDFGEDEYGIPALADEEPMGEDDEYDELYNDVNVGEGFLHMHHPEAPSQPGGMANSGVGTQKNDVLEIRIDVGVSRGQSITGAPVHGKYPGVGASFPEQSGATSH